MLSQEWAISRDWCQVLHPLPVLIFFYLWSFIVLFCHLFEKTCGAPWPQFGAASRQASSGWQLARRLYSRLLEPKDRHRDIIDIEMIFHRFKKHASLLMCLFLLQLLHNISLFGCMLCLFDHHIHRLHLLSLNRWEHWKSEKMQQRFCRLRETSRKPCPSSVCCEALQKVDGFILLTRLLQLLSGADRCFSAIFAHCCILTVIQQCRDISMHYSSFLRLDSRIIPLFQGSAFQKWVQDILGWFAFQWSKSMSQLWTSWEDINAANEEKQEENNEIKIRRLEVTGLRNAGMRERHWNQVGEGNRRHFWMLQNVAIAWLYNAIWYQNIPNMMAYYAFVNFSTTHVA